MKIKCAAVRDSRLLSTLALLLGAQFFAVAEGASPAEILPSATVPLKATASPPIAAASPQIVADYGKLPLQFEVNAGQADAAVQYLARGPDYALFLTSDEAVLKLVYEASSEAKTSAMTGNTLRMSLVGAKTGQHLRGTELQSGHSNYFIGKDERRWHTKVARYAKVESPNVYPGIDLVYYGNQQQLEYDFVVAPHANPAAIRLKFDGAEDLAVNGDGDLVVRTKAGELVQHKPVVYQEIAGRKIPREGRYVLHRNHEASIQVAAYDAGQTLVIDPVQVYSTYLGGGGSDGANHVAVDGAGNAYVTGITASSNFPTRNPVQAVRSDSDERYDVFVAKLSADGSTLLYSTYLGGRGSDESGGVAVDATGSAYVTGFAAGADFPTRNPLQVSCGNDAFITKLSADGSALVYSTCLGGSDADRATGIALDAAGSAYVTGFTLSTNFPTVNPLQPAIWQCGPRSTTRATPAATSAGSIRRLPSCPSSRRTGRAWFIPPISISTLTTLEATSARLSMIRVRQASPSTARAGRIWLCSISSKTTDPSTSPAWPASAPTAAAPS